MVIPVPNSRTKSSILVRLLIYIYQTVIRYYHRTQYRNIIDRAHDTTAENWG